MRVYATDPPILDYKLVPFEVKTQIHSAPTAIPSFLNSRYLNYTTIYRRFPWNRRVPNPTYGINQPTRGEADAMYAPTELLKQKRLVPTHMSPDEICAAIMALASDLHGRARLLPAAP